MTYIISLMTENIWLLTFHSEIAFGKMYQELQWRAREAEDFEHWQGF